MEPKSERFLRRRINSLVAEVHDLRGKGNNQLARSRLESTLVYAKKWLGVSDREVPRLLLLLGDLLRRQGELEDARLCYLESWLLEEAE